MLSAKPGITFTHVLRKMVCIPEMRFDSLRVYDPYGLSVRCQDGGLIGPSL